ncbi:MAG: ABC transporter permease [Agriterribacter sp.]
MLKNFFKIAWRNLFKSKTYSIINIVGLATSLAACILLLLWVQDEVSFDGFNKKEKDIYRLTAAFDQGGSKNFWGTTPGPIATFGKAEVPEVVSACRISDNWHVNILKYNNKKFQSTRYGMADASIFSIFDFPLISGNADKPFTDDLSIIVSETTAKKMFGNTDVLGKVLEGDDKNLYHITGVMKDMPSNSSTQYDIIFNFDFQKRNYDGKGYWKSLDEDWGNYNYSTFFLLKPNTNADATAQKLTAIHRRNQEGDFTQKLNYILAPLSKVHLYTPDGKEEGMMIVRVFFIVAVIVLIIACINYVNLVTARATKRAKEISLRKIIGADKLGLFWQFLSESFLLFFIAMLVATLLIYLVMPLYNDISGKAISFNPFSKNVLLVYGATLVATLALAGVYPAITLSSFRPLEAMKGKLSGLGTKGTFRKILVVVQFSFSIILIVSTIVIGNQLKYIRQKNLGYDKENIFSFNMRNIYPHYESVKADLLNQPGVTGVTAAGSDIMNNWSSTGDAEWEGKPAGEMFIINQISVDRNFVSTMGIQLAEGKGFTGTPADSTNYILNEAAVKAMNMKDPVGKSFTFHDKKGTVVAVAKDFHFQNLHKKIEPVILFYNPEWRQLMYVKTTGKDASKAIAAVDKIWNQYNADYAFDYRFLDNAFENDYKADIRVGKLFNCFAIITILISCLGLFGLVTYTAETKVKEIGVRKVLGASVGSIVNMLSKDFLKLVLVAALIAFPVAYWALHNMMQQYSYRAPVHWWIFAIAGIITLLIALLTISFQAIKAAMTNPVKSLRSE